MDPRGARHGLVDHLRDAESGDVRGQVAGSQIDLKLSGALNNQKGIIESDHALTIDAASEYARAKTVDYQKMATVQKAFSERYLKDVQ